MIDDKDPRRGFSAMRYAAVTKSDTQSTMPWGAGAFADYLYVEGAGSLVLIDSAGNTTTVNVVANSWFWGTVSCVKAASTATGITGFFN